MGNDILVSCIMNSTSRIDNGPDKTKGSMRRTEFLEATFKSLSPEEQEEANRDIYGTLSPVEETPEFINAR